MKYLCILTLALAATTTEAFSMNRPVPAMRSSKTALNSHADISRRNALQSILVPAMATVVTSFAQPAFADVTNKVASQASLRYVKRSMKELEKLEFFASQNDYSEMKEGIRAPGLSEIRKNMRVLIRGGEDSAEAENLQNAYDTFIKSIEELGGAANLGVR